MKDNKNYNFSNDLKRLGPKLKWFLFTEMQDLKLTSDYIDFICPSSNQSSQESNPVENLRKLVEQALVREFSPDIKNMKSYDVLVDAIMHNIQKKELGIEGDDDLKKLFED